jgi:hypothetical protein
MKITELKKIVRETWERMHWLEGAIAQPNSFKTEMRGYGDLRRRATWEKAYIYLQAEIISKPVLERGHMIQLYFVHPEAQELVEYNDQVLDAYLQYGHSLESIRDGLEQLWFYASEPEDREDAIAFIKRLSGLPQLPDGERMLRDLLPATA